MKGKEGEVGDVGFDESVYRSVAARGNYLAQDRPDLQYAMKEVCRNMSKPTKDDWPLVKRVARYLLNSPRLVLNMRKQALPDKIVVWTDSDYAGCTRTRKSTSGGLIMFGSHCIKSWSSTQDVVALSSGEAEYYAMVKAVSQAIGVRNLLKDLEINVSIQINTDASAAKAIASRRGCGRVRHIDVATLWVQEKVANGEVKVQKVPGTENLADVLTKHVDRSTLDKHLTSMGFTRHYDRHSIMPKLEER
jgi:hypothetical protein